LPGFSAAVGLDHVLDHPRGRHGRRPAASAQALTTPAVTSREACGVADRDDQLPTRSVPASPSGAGEVAASRAQHGQVRRGSDPTSLDVALAPVPTRPRRRRREPLDDVRARQGRAVGGDRHSAAGSAHGPAGACGGALDVGDARAEPLSDRHHGL